MTKHLIFIFSLLHLSNGQDFLSLIAPLARGGGGGGGLGSLLASVSQLQGGGGGGRGQGARAAAETAQTLISTFTNSGSGSGTNNPFSQFIGLPLGSALSHPAPPNAPNIPKIPVTKRTRRPKPTTLSPTPPPIFTAPPSVAVKSEEESDFDYFDGQADGSILLKPSSRAQAVRQHLPQHAALEPPAPSINKPPDIFTLLEPLAQRTRERVEAKRRQSEGGSYSHNQRAPSRLSSPIGRLADNFGNNFFKMITELHDYAKVGPTPRGGTPNGIGLLPADRQAHPPEVQLSPDAREAADIMNTNQMMRAFLRTMSKNPSNQLRPLAQMNDGTEIGRNRPMMDQLFESDILLTSRQMKAIVLAEAERKDGPSRRVKRKVITGSVYRWPKQKPIPYSFRENDTKWRNLIREGLRLWERETCIRFIENGPGKNRIEFIRGSGCYSGVGKTGGSQKISIGFGCDDKGIVSHEVGHSLGFWHEQSRYDRDKYIYLKQQFIAGGTEGNFAKRSDLEIDGMGLPYDLGSVMHYGPTAFTTDWNEITIMTLDKKYQHTIGQRLKPSFIDVKQINRLYCFNSCTGTTVQCVNGGYADPNDCNKCKCPQGLGGADCSQIQHSDGICGGDLSATNTWQYLTHKGKQHCIWRISANGARIRFILDSVKYKCETTCHSYLEVKHNSDFQQVGFRVCCDEKNVEVVSEQDEILIMTQNDSEHSAEGAFSLRYIQDSGAPLPRPPPPAWIPGSENRAFRGVKGKGGVIEKFILNAIPRVRDPQRPVESVFSILTDYFASSLLGTQRDQ